jgi:uncharacterized protein YndB with AHSA1/START domain
MNDLLTHLTAVHRAVDRLGTASGETVTLTLRRSYPADLEDVWDAVTAPERLSRWFLPVTGDLRPGGSFQLEGNAGGDILACEPPARLQVTFGGPTSVVDVRLSADGGTTVLELEHHVPIEIAQSGAGALFAGPGWDDAFMVLARHLAGEDPGDPVAEQTSPDRVGYQREALAAWRDVVAASGTATAEELEGTVAFVASQFDAVG